MQQRWPNGKLIRITLLLLLLAPVSYGPEAQSHRPTIAANSASTPTDKSTKGTEPTAPSAHRMTPAEQGLKGGEHAVAQAMVALAQVRAPVAMLKKDALDDKEPQSLLNAVERDVDAAMNAYQNAVLASTDAAVLALSTKAQIAAISAQVWVNIAVARLQLHLLRQHLSNAPLTITISQSAQQDHVLASATQAMARALAHAEVTQKQMQAATISARQVESAFSDAESTDALTNLKATKIAIKARAMALGTQVMLLSAHVTGDPMAIAVTQKAANTADTLVKQLEGPSLSPVAQRAQAAVLRVRMAIAVTQVALAQGYAARLKPPKAAEAAVAVVADQARSVEQAAQAATKARTEDVARILVQAAEVGALAAAVTARIADAYIRLQMVQGREGVALAVTARLAASEQLRTAVIHTQAAIASAAAAHATAMEAQSQEATGKMLTQEMLATMRRAKEQTESQAYLGIAWAQSASYWTQSAWAWAQNIDEVALASEAAAVAAESAATMVEATVGVAVGATVGQEALDTSSMATFVTTASLASPSEGDTPDGFTPDVVMPTPLSDSLLPSDEGQLLGDNPGPPPADVASPSR